MCVCVGGGGGAVVSASVRVTMSGGHKTPTVGKKEILLLGVHFTADV